MVSAAMEICVMCPVMCWRVMPRYVKHFFIKLLCIFNIISTFYLLPLN
jgi:hypothetical protein